MSVKYAGPGLFSGKDKVDDRQDKHDKSDKGKKTFQRETQAHQAVETGCWCGWHGLYLTKSAPHPGKINRGMIFHEKPGPAPQGYPAEHCP
jgi:hypothetical protein